MIAGGVESMSRAPWVLPKPERAFPRRQRDAALHHPGLADGQPADAASEWTVALGEGAEILAEQYGITREEQDEFALRSHERAAARPGTAGAFDARPCVRCPARS